MKRVRAGLIGVLAIISSAVAGPWETLDTEGGPAPRHEAELIECNGRFYLMAGRRIEP